DGRAVGRRGHLPADLHQRTACRRLRRHPRPRSQGRTRRPAGGLMSATLDMALIQTRTPATAAAGLAHVEPLIRRAAAEGARLILTPEGTNLLEQRRGLRDAALSTEDGDPAVLGLRALAHELGVWLL